MGLGKGALVQPNTKGHGAEPGEFPTRDVLLLSRNIRGNSVLAAISCNRNYSPWKPGLHLEPFASCSPCVLGAVNPTGFALSVFPHTEQLLGSRDAASVQDNGISGCRVGSHTEQPTALLQLTVVSRELGRQEKRFCFCPGWSQLLENFTSINIFA